MISVLRQSAKGHPLSRNGECARLVAERMGRPVFSMTVGVDRRYVRLTGEAQGWFDEVEGEDDPEAARSVIAGAAAFARGLGVERIFGPAAPRPLPGLKVEGAGARPHIGRLLAENGFQVPREYVSFHIPPQERPEMARAAARARRTRAVSVRQEGYTKAGCLALYALYEPARLSFEDFAEALDRLRPWKAYVASVRGVDAGFALVRREEGVSRVETVMITPPFRRGPALLCLLDSLRMSMGPRVITGAIARDNAPSMAVARSLDGVIYELWREYILYLI